MKTPLSPSENISVEQMKKLIHARLEIIKAVAACIKDAGEIPNGHLYAMLMSELDFNTYMSTIQVLKDAGVVTETNNLLRWVGKEKEQGK